MKKFSLDTHPKIRSGFTVPPNYFEELPTQILARIEAESVKKSILHTLKPYILAVAAVLILALSISILWKNEVDTLEQIDTATLENYITYQSNVSQYELGTLINPKDLEEMEFYLRLEDKAVEDILTTNPNFENYIID